MTAPRQKIMTPALMAALAGLVVLAVVTIVVVARSGSDESGAAPTPTPTIAADPTASGEGTFTYVAPTGYIDGMDQPSIANTFTVMVYDPDLGDLTDNKTIAIGVTVTDVISGNDLSDYVAGSIDIYETVFETSASEVDAIVTSIDGEQAIAVETDEYNLTGETRRSYDLHVIRGGKIVVVMMSALPENFDDGKAALEAFANSMKWT